MDASEHAFLSFFEPEAAADLLASGETCAYRSGDMVFLEGDEADYMYLVLSGTIELTKEMEDGSSHLVATISDNDFFGEFGVLDKRPRSAGARAQGVCKLFRLPAEAVFRAMASSGPAGTKVAIQVIRKIRESNRKHIDEILRRERLAMVGKMLNGIVHDFRNPFAVIKMAAELIKMTGPDAWIQEQCDAILEQMDRVTHMTEEVLSFTRGHTAVSMMEFDIADMLAKFEKLNTTFLSQQGIELTVEYSTRKLMGDDQRLMRVLQNLVYNAAEILGQGGAISVRQENRKRSLVLHVRDNGPGMPEEIQGTLFEAFATHGKKNGLGLGLAIAKSIVQAHEGSISFTTAPGEGTTFHVELPCL